MPGTELRRSRALREPRSAGRPFPIGEPTLGIGEWDEGRVLEIRTWCRAGTGTADIVVQIPAGDFERLAATMARVDPPAARAAMLAALDATASGR
ncbi:MAG: hypothetical protein OXC28_02480 [Defluviicoccus sp.]|nr:hypothetical protein [Defluviicoccus sp.]